MQRGGHNKPIDLNASALARQLGDDDAVPLEHDAKHLIADTDFTGLIAHEVVPLTGRLAGLEIGNVLGAQVNVAPFVRGDVLVGREPDLRRTCCG